MQLCNLVFRGLCKSIVTSLSLRHSAQNYRKLISLGSCFNVFCLGWKAFSEAISCLELCFNINDLAGIENSVMSVMFFYLEASEPTFN